MAAAADEALADGCDVASLAAEAARLVGEAAEAQAAREEAARLEAELADVRAEAEGVAAQLRAVAPAAAVASEQAGQAGAALDRLRAELSEAAQGHPSVAARQAALRRSAGPTVRWDGPWTHSRRASRTQARARERADGEALGRGFATLEEAAAAALAPPEQASLADQVNAWDRAMAALTAAVQATDLAGLDPGRAGEIAARAETTAAGLALARQAEREALAASQAAARKAERFAQRTGDVRAVEDDYDRRGGGDRGGDPPGRAGQRDRGPAAGRADHLCAAALVRPGGCGGQRAAVGDVLGTVRAEAHRRGQGQAGPLRADPGRDRPAHRCGAQRRLAVRR